MVIYDFILFRGLQKQTSRYKFIEINDGSLSFFISIYIHINFSLI